MAKNEKKQKAGRKGGKATYQKHGKSHMSEIGKRGAAELWRRYQLTPVHTAGWALVEKATGRVKAVWG